MILHKYNSIFIFGSAKPIAESHISNKTSANWRKKKITKVWPTKKQSSFMFYIKN